MAKQVGIFKVEGLLDDVSFYKSEDGYRIRRKGGVSADRIATDPAFQRTRENGKEFGDAAKAGQLVRHAFSTFISGSSDDRVVSRLVKRMMEISRLDTTSIRGERNVNDGISTPAGKELLKGFNFNRNAQMSSVLMVPYTVDLTSGDITISNLVAGNNLSYPIDATHYRISGAFALIDFDAKTSVVALTDVWTKPIDFSPVTVTVTAAPPTGTGIKVVMLHVEFLQQVNGALYPLKSGVNNAMAVVEVV